jgi:replicative DNA helicase
MNAAWEQLREEFTCAHEVEARRRVIVSKGKEVTTVHRQCTHCGERHNCAILAISSQNRSGYTAGGMASLKESGDLEYGCDVLMTLARPEEKNGEKKPPPADGSVRLKLVVDKNRQGMTGRPIPVRLHGDSCLVEEDEGV